MRTLLAALSVLLLLTGCSGGTRDDEQPQDDSQRVDLSGQAAFEPDGLFSVQPEQAELDGDELQVSVVLTALDVPLTVGTERAVYAAGATLLKAADAPEVSIDPGAAQEVVLTFPAAADVTLDGQVTFEVSVGGQPATSVVFGLAPVG